VVQPHAILGGVGTSFLKFQGPRTGHDETLTSEDGIQSGGFFSYPLVWQGYMASTEVHLHITFDSSVLTETQLSVMTEQFCHVVGQLLAPEVHLETTTVLLEEISLSGSYDAGLMTQWNKLHEAEIISSTLHVEIGRQADIRPSAPAIVAWDGHLTYRELDDVSTRWAILLSYKCHIRTDELVAVCFEKSVWFYVAILAINKAGGAWVPLAPSHPPHRHMEVVKQACARLLLTSSQELPKWRDVVEHAEVLSREGDERLERMVREKGMRAPVNTVQPHDIAYVLFTSGTTGTPKGMVMEHGALCTSMTASAKRLEIDPDRVRLLQFAAYVFDLAIGEIVLPLFSGACICIPSEHQRMNDLPSFIAESKANWAFLTPSFARILLPADVPSLELLLLGGKAVGKDHLTRWTGHVRLINTWGPSEVCCFASFCEYKSANDSPVNIRLPVGARAWIVEPDDYHRLAPIGCIGEVVLQGPTLAREYLAFESGTNASFVTDLPGWAPDRDSPQYSTFYKSGDLAYFNPDGTMEFVARKDTQVKVRGFRIELGEVESQVHDALSSIKQVTVDVLKAEEGSQSASRLVAYICFSQATREPGLDGAEFSHMFLPMDKTMAHEVLALKSLLDIRLPAYMVPAAYIPVRYMPLSTSQKTDRNVLRRGASMIPDAEFASYMLADASKEPPATTMEIKMQGFWAAVLGIPSERIGRNDSFLRLGGDSLTAIRLIAKSRESGFQLSVSDIFRDPRLSQVALAATQRSVEDEEVPPWSLVPADQREALRRAAEQQCNLPDDLTIEDIYPTTALQEGLTALAVRQPGSYTARFAFELGGADTERFKAAWDHTLEACAALRTRIFRYESRTMQAVIQGPARWQLSSAELSQMEYGTALCQYTLSSNGDSAVFSLTMHHAIFDGWSLSLIMQTLASAYEGGSIVRQPLASYSRYIRYV
jgi:amino acid adenylation domain-containing protein